MVSQDARGPGRPFALTREQIGDAVLEFGLEEVTVKALASRLGVSERTLYNYAPGRNGLLALGMERAMREVLHDAQLSFPSESGWRDILEGVVDWSWTFMNTVPSVGALIARGIHSRAEADYAASIGVALVERGFTADQAMEALALVFSLVSTAFVEGQRMDVPPPGDTASERDEVVPRLAPGSGADTVVCELHAAMARALWQPTKRILDRRVALVLDGMEARYGLG